MRVLQVVSCQGWSSDAYWAARISTELLRQHHEVRLVCRRGTEDRVIRRARESGVERIETLGLQGGVKPISDARDLGRLAGWLATTDVVHVHRGKEHWLAAIANRVSGTPRPLVRTRHIVQPIRPHALNRWLYGRATSLVVTVTDAIRRQYVAAELVPPDRVVALPGGVDLEQFHPRVHGTDERRALGVGPGVPLIGLVSGLRVMKGHRVAIDAVARLRDAGRRVHLLCIGQGKLEASVREAIASAGLGDRVTLAGFVPDLPGAIAAVDIALYAAIESDGMSRVLFECLAVGRPVIASRVGVVPEVLEDARTALLIPAGDPGALAGAIGRVLDDARLGVALGAAGAELARTRLSGACVARELARHYARLVEARRASCDSR
jgi:glycosyltransferase involved in cell wall biosynthesis